MQILLKSVGLFSCLFLVLLLLFPCCALYADDDGLKLSEIERKTSSNELPLDRGFEPVEGTYHYDVFLAGAKLGRASIRVDREEGEYRVAVNARTRGAMKYLYRVKYRGEALISREQMEPSVARIEEKTGNKRKSIRAEYSAANKIVATEREKRGEGEEKVKTREFESESFILDPFSTVFLVRSLDWQVGTAEIFDLFTGSRQYELQLKCTDETELNFDGSPREAWIIEPETRTVKEPKKVKMSGLKIYLSKDERKEILKITGHPKIGRIVADLRKFDKKK